MKCENAILLTELIKKIDNLDVKLDKRDAAYNERFIKLTESQTKSRVAIATLTVKSRLWVILGGSIPVLLIIAIEVLKTQ